MKIGTFIQNNDGFIQGNIHGLGMGVTPVIFEPQTSKNGGEYFRLIAGDKKMAYEIGAAFPKQKGSATYYSVNLDSPVLAAPISAALFPDKGHDGVFSLVWNRPEPQDLKAEATVNTGSGKTQTRRFTNPTAMPS